MRLLLLLLLALLSLGLAVALYILVGLTALHAKYLVANPSSQLLLIALCLQLLLGQGVKLVVGAHAYRFIATRIFAERERGLRATSSEVGTIALREITSKGVC